MPPELTPPPHAVRIAYRNGGEVKIVGSGTIIDDRLVLTARHVLDGLDGGSVVVLLDDLTAIGAVPLLPDSDWDVALLGVSREEVAFKGRAVLLGDRGTEAGATWDAWGCPRVVLGANENTSLRSFQGVTPRVVEGAQRFEITTVNRPKAQTGLQGVSGAGVCRGQQLLGVITSQDLDWAKPLLNVIAVSGLLQQDWFQALRREHGRTSATAEDWDYHAGRLEDELDTLLDDLQALCQADPALARVLARALSRPRQRVAPSEVAAAVRRSPCFGVAEALSQAWGTLGEAGRMVDAAGFLDLWVRFLPLLVEFQELVLRYRLAAERDAWVFDVPWRSGALAEVLTAGAAERCAGFAPRPDGEGLWGAGFRTLPQVLVRGRIDADPVLVREAIELDTTAVEDLVADALGVVRPHKQGGVSPLDSRLKARITARNPRFPPLALVMEDARFAAPGHLWQVVLQAVHGPSGDGAARLPHLQLVRLRDQESALPFDDGALEEHIRMVRLEES